MSADAPRDRLLVASNRLPFVLNREQSGEWRITPGTGGLVTALLPVLRDRGGIWIGWPGTIEDPHGVQGALDRSVRDAGYALKGVTLTPEEVHNFYFGFSNEIVWPLFHDHHSYCNFDPKYWQAYVQVNRKYAGVIAGNAQPGDFIWVHDYHLINVALELRRRDLDNRFGFFLHIPFPSPDIFLKLPWRFELLHALLQYDLVGFQTLRDRRNFIQCLRTLCKDVTVSGKGQVLAVKADGREVRVGAFAISIDFEAFQREAGSDAVVAECQRLHDVRGKRQLLLGIDRLDYTKGIPNRLRAFEEALRRFPELQTRVTLVQVVVPSREDIPMYHDLRIEIERLVGHINGSFTRAGGWVPIHYLFRTLSRTELLSLYRTADIGLVTPLKDGMNLVGKEFCAASIDETSVLILSEFAGAAAQLQNGALIVNPYDVEGMAEAIYQAYRMEPAERQVRMRRMRRVIARQDIFWWVDSFLRAAIARDLSAFPLLEDFNPAQLTDVFAHHVASVEPATRPDKPR
jgi:trehalose 6-phosphate synthase/phosphatase